MLSWNLTGVNSMWVAATILIVAYGFIIAERINRAIIALLGFCAVIILGVLTQQEAVRAIDFNTIGLLAGMMIVVSITGRSGLFQYVALLSVKVARANPAALLVLLSLVTAVCSALLDNVTTVLFIVPITLAVTRDLEVPPYPFLFAEIFASNIGGAATLVGDPPNILIGSLAQLSFNDFLWNLAPVIVVILILQTFIMHMIWGRSLRAAPERRALVMGLHLADTIQDRRLMQQSLCVISLVTLGFTCAHPLGFEPATIALLGAALLLLLENWPLTPEAQTIRVHKTFVEVEWITIVFFAGLFVIVHGVEASGLLHLLAEMLLHQTGGDLETTTYAILWSSAVLSAILDNIPFVATMIPLIKSMAPVLGGEHTTTPLWWSLALGACLGGNGSLIGASATLAVAGMAERNGVPFRFWTFTKLGFPLMLLSIAVSHLYLWWRYF